MAYLDKNGKHPQKIGKFYAQKTIPFLNNNVKEGGIYALRYDYVGKNKGHIVVVEKKNGKLLLYDPQSNSKRTALKDIMDLTDVKLDEKFCDKIMKRR